EVTLALLKPDLLMDPASIHTILEEIHSHNIHITRRKTLQWTRAEAEQFYNEHQGRFFFNRLVGYMTSGPLMALELSGPGVISKWRGMLGSTHPVRMRVERPKCLRARFGLTDTRNAFHGSDSLEAAKRELKFIFK
ncbi:nucleoside diphosphate kinase, partial [Kickxella alabastrina]|uniref:nucleoside diphosphate kinase n=1 Tax=Kickxella alabastrina TaxID=61397 RepID=UPI00221E8EB5